MEELLAAATLQSPMKVYNYEDVTRLYVLYRGLDDNPAWKDYTARIVKAREEIKKELYLGSLDKHGNSRDNEKRAILSVLDRLLSFVPLLTSQYDTLTKRKADQEKKLSRRTGIHGQDELNINLGTGGLV